MGRESARLLASAGANVVLACRSVASGESIRGTIAAAVADSEDRLDVLPLNMASLASVRQCADQFKAKYPELHVLVNHRWTEGEQFSALEAMSHSGGADREPLVTEDGFEYHMGTNVLGPFLLTALLMDRLRRTAGGCRVVNVCSDAHLEGAGLDPSVDFFRPRGGAESGTTTDTGRSIGGGGGSAFVGLSSRFCFSRKNSSGASTRADCCKWAAK